MRGRGGDSPATRWLGAERGAGRGLPPRPRGHGLSQHQGSDAQRRGQQAPPRPPSLRRSCKHRTVRSNAVGTALSADAPGRQHVQAGTRGPRSPPPGRPPSRRPPSRQARPPGSLTKQGGAGPPSLAGSAGFRRPWLGQRGGPGWGGASVQVLADTHGAGVGAPRGAGVAGAGGTLPGSPLTDIRHRAPRAPVAQGTHRRNHADPEEARRWGGSRGPSSEPGPHPAAAPGPSLGPRMRWLRSPPR